MTASDTNPEGGIVKYYWDLFGDGWEDSSDVPQYEFTNPEGGWTTVIWGAKDDDGVFGLDTFRVHFNRTPSLLNVQPPSESDKWIAFDRYTGKGSFPISLLAEDKDRPEDTLVYTLYLGPSADNLSQVYSSKDSVYNVSDLDSSETVHWRLVVKDVLNDSASATGVFTTPPPPPPSICQDGAILDTRDNKIYKCVVIGTQTWMKEDLAWLPRVDLPSDGSESDENGKYYYVYDYTPSGSDETEEVLNAKASSNYQTYGVLYNWNAAMDGSTSSAAIPSSVKGACPEGWHFPSDDEWKILEMFLGMSQSDANRTSVFSRGSDEGKKLKTVVWNGTDNHGFTALPGGYRDIEGCSGLGTRATYWTATQSVKDTTQAWRRSLDKEYNDIGRSDYRKTYGRSVRCVRD